MPGEPGPPADLLSDLDEVARIMAGFEGDWWVIGSAAILLSGVPNLEPQDIDILVSDQGARELCSRLRASAIDMPRHDKFRSDLFFRHRLVSRDMEVMGGFTVATAVGWEAFWPEDTRLVQSEAGTLRLPAVSDLVRMCRLFGRAKDIARIPALEALPR